MRKMVRKIVKKMVRNMQRKMHAQEDGDMIVGNIGSKDSQQTVREMVRRRRFLQSSCFMHLSLREGRYDWG